jgi:tetratricopeptide (TPR) repeat protein
MPRSVVTLTFLSAALLLFRISTLHGQVPPSAIEAPTHPQQSVQDKSYRTGILLKVDSLLEAKYVLPEKAQLFATEFRKLCSAGAYDSCETAAAFADKVKADLQSITGDKHITFRVIQSSDIGEKVESALHHPIRYYRLRMKEHTGFSKLEWIDGKIGYLELRRFNSVDEAKPLIAAAMTFLHDADAIIIDLRENGGGSGDYLSSYFLPHPTQLTGCYYREEDYLAECWTSREISGERMIDVPLFVLTSARTFSAAESFAYDMKVGKRATLVGEPTKGGAHDVDYFKLDDQFEMYIPTGRAVNPVTKGNWEGVGVIPDVVVPSSSALDTAIVLARSAGERYAKRKEMVLSNAVDEMQARLDQAERSYREKKVRSARAALDSVFAVGVKAGVITEFFINVLAYNYRSMQDAAILIDILTKGIELFPTSPAAYESLAMGYATIGETESALRYYNKALQLDPDNRNTASTINMLQHKMKKTK